MLIEGQSGWSRELELFAATYSHPAFYAECCVKLCDDRDSRDSTCGGTLKRIADECHEGSPRASVKARYRPHAANKASSIFDMETR